MYISFYNLWHYGSRFGEIPLPYFGVVLSVSFFALIYYFFVAVKEVLENKKQNILW